MIGVLLWASIVSSAFAENRERIVATCPDLEVCFDQIEQTIPDYDNGRVYLDAQNIAETLKTRFGESAREALLQKGIGEHGGWRNFAHNILRHWEGWSEADIEQLEQLLNIDSGGVIAHALAEIGTDEAIAILFRDLARSGMRNQTGFALRRLGPEVLTHALPVLAMERRHLPPYQRGWTAASSLVWEFGSRATFIADDWIEIATDESVSVENRIAALRGLAAMGGHLGDRSPALRSLLSSPDEEIADAAYEVLLRSYDPSVAVRHARTCKPEALVWDQFARRAKVCLGQLADFGSNGERAGAEVLPFLDSENTAERLYAIEALGLIGYRLAIPEIEDFLKSEDWRLRYAAIRALGHLSSKDSVPKIEAAAADYWLDELNWYARAVVQSLIRNQPAGGSMPSSWSGYGSFGAYDSPYEKRRDCKSGDWSFGDVEFRVQATNRADTVQLEVEDGLLVGVDQGEFGGALVWKPEHGEEVTLWRDNTYALHPVDGGYISIHGSAHMIFNHGYAVFSERTDDGRYRSGEIARFPSMAGLVNAIGGGRFAADFGGRVLVFSKDGILGSARCERQAR